MALEDGSGGGDHVERQVGSLGNVEERMPTIGEIEHPEHRHVPGPGVLAATDGGIESAPAKLRLALGGEIDQSAVCVERNDAARCCGRMKSRLSAEV